MSIVSFDLHGVIDTEPEAFSYIAKELIKKGWTVYVLTGRRSDNTIIDDLNKSGFKPFHRLLSIVDYNIDAGTHVDLSDPFNPVMDEVIWNSSKARMCTKYGINVHIDDSDIYHQYFTVPYLYVKDGTLIEVATKNGIHSPSNWGHEVGFRFDIKKQADNIIRMIHTCYRRK